MKRENWLPVEGYENYEVSSEGRVRSLNYNHTGEIRILKPSKNEKGYLRVHLTKDGKKKWFRVHRLVAQAFVPNMFNLNEVNHINEDKTDNRAENLMWVDRIENCNWSSRNERISEKNTNGKLSKPILQFLKSGELIKVWPSINEVHRILGYSQGNISECCRGERKSAYGFVWKYKAS